MLEKRYNWTGLCFEPLPHEFNLLKQNRSQSVCINKALFNTTLKLQFCCYGLLSGLTDYIDRHLEAKNGHQITVETISLNDAMTFHNVPSFVEYLSVDAQGAEFEILKTIDFDKFKFGIIHVEHNYVEPKRTNIRKHLESNGYVYIRENKWDDEYFLESLYVEQLNEFNVKLVQIENDLSKIIMNQNQNQKSRQLNLIFSYYRDMNKKRANEIDLAVKLNVSNKLFKRILIVNETDENLIDKFRSYECTFDHVTIINNKARLKFSDFFAYMNQYTNDDNDDINVLINSDIIIGENFDKIDLKSNQMICLSRHEIIVNNTNEIQYEIKVGGGSHDCWIWKGQINNATATATAPATATIGNFYMGKYLCDGVLANELCNNGYILKSSFGHQNLSFAH